MSTVFHFNKRKVVSIIIFVALIAVIMITSTACVDPFEYRASRISPHDYPGSEWQSDDPNIYLYVLKDKSIRGYILLNNAEVRVHCSIEWGRFVEITRTDIWSDVVKESDYLLEGVCDCTERQIVIEVRKDYCFDGKYETIVLNRIDEPEEVEND